MAHPIQLPLVTIIVPARPGQTELQSLAGIRRLDYPRDRIEVIIARGKQPSAQRNAALRQAKGEIVYFLDDDSIPEPENIKQALQSFESPQTAIVGGPNLCPPDAPALERSFALTMGALLAFGPSSSRYKSRGARRSSGEKELILCNMLARREAMLEFGGFDERLYPNEENALMDKIQASGRTLVYDPDLIVFRRPRSNFKAFCKMLVNYGRGRAEQFRVHPTMGSAPNLVPPLFFIYLLAWLWLPLWLKLGLVVYCVAVFFQAIAVTGTRKLGLVLHVALLVFLTHLLYGFGFLKGLLTTLKNPNRETHPVTLEELAL